MSKVRMNIEVSKEVADFLEEVAASEDTTKTEIVRRALSVLKAYKQQKARGRNHIGFTNDASKLEAEIVGILDAS
jgi:predicted transcriptional regulator